MNKEIMGFTQVELNVFRVLWRWGFLKLTMVDDDDGVTTESFTVSTRGNSDDEVRNLQEMLVGSQAVDELLVFKASHFNIQNLYRYFSDRIAHELETARTGSSEIRERQADQIKQCFEHGMVWHRWIPSPEAGPGWRCSECGEVANEY